MTTLGVAWNLALDLADMTGSEFPVEARGINYGNTALRILHVALANAHNGDYFRSEDSIAVVGGTESYSLPSDFMRAIKVFYEPSGSNYRFAVQKFQIDEMDGSRTSPINDGNVNLWYIPTPTELAAVGDTIPAIYPVGTVDFVAYHMAVQLLNREESFDQAQIYAGERSNILGTIIDAIAPRDETPEEIADVYNRWGPSGRHYAAGNDCRYLYRIMGGEIHFSEYR